jgi:hypothetical protein
VNPSQELVLRLLSNDISPDRLSPRVPFGTTHGK